MSDKLYPARWEPDGADECGILYCHDAVYAFGIDPDAEGWWGVELAKAINDAHDLRALVRAAATIIEYGINRLDDDIAIREQCAWLDKARAILGDWHDSLDAAVPGTGTMLRREDGEA